jgi:hypothetical protein
MWNEPSAMAPHVEPLPRVALRYELLSDAHLLRSNATEVVSSCGPIITCLCWSGLRLAGKDNYSSQVQIVNQEFRLRCSS